MAPCDVVLDVLSHILPPIYSLDKLQSACLSQVSCNWRIVIKSEDLAFDFQVVGDIDLLVMVGDPIIDDDIVWKW